MEQTTQTQVRHAEGALKVCCGCHQSLPLTEFHRRGDKHKPRCKKCVYVQAQKYMTPERKEHIKLYNRARAHEIYEGYKKSRDSSKKAEPVYGM